MVADKIAQIESQPVFELSEGWGVSWITWRTMKIQVQLNSFKNKDPKNKTKGKNTRIVHKEIHKANTSRNRKQYCSNKGSQTKG